MSSLIESLKQQFFIVTEDMRRLQQILIQIENNLPDNIELFPGKAVESMDVLQLCESARKLMEYHYALSQNDTSGN
jgi:glycerol-3-phosphate responsive antiterminator